MVNFTPSQEEVSLREPAMKAATGPVQVYGGYGFIKEHLMRDGKIMQLCVGTSQIQWVASARETLVSRRVDELAVAG